MTDGEAQKCMSRQAPEILQGHSCRPHEDRQLHDQEGEGLPHPPHKHHTVDSGGGWK